MGVRIMQKGDLDKILEMENRLQHKPWTRTAFEQALRLNHFCIVYEGENGIEGYGVGDSGHGRTIAAENTKAAGALYRAWFEQAKQQGVTKLYAEIQPDNAAARARLERFGFSRAGERPNYYGPGLNAVVYERLLDIQEPTQAQE